MATFFPYHNALYKMYKCSSGPSILVHRYSVKANQCLRKPAAPVNLCLIFICNSSTAVFLIQPTARGKLLHKACFERMHAWFLCTMYVRIPTLRRALSITRIWAQCMYAMLCAMNSIIIISVSWWKCTSCYCWHLVSSSTFLREMHTVVVAADAQLVLYALAANS